MNFFSDQNSYLRVVLTSYFVYYYLHVFDYLKNGEANK